MNARGTRRPHPRRVRSKPMRRVGKGGAISSNGCAVLVLAFLAAPPFAFAVWLVAR